MCKHDRSQFHEKRVCFESMYANTNVRDFTKKKKKKKKVLFDDDVFATWKKGNIFVILKNVKS